VYHERHSDNLLGIKKSKESALISDRATYDTLSLHWIITIASLINCKQKSQS